MADLSVNFCGNVLKNPIVVSSGEPTGDYEHMVAAIEAGAGGVIAKSVAFTKELDLSSKKTRFTIIDEDRKVCKKGKYPKMFTLYGRGGIPLEPSDWMHTLMRVNKVAEKHGALLIGSIATGPLEEMAETARRMQESGIKVIELDAGCPQVTQLGLDDSSMEYIESHQIAGIITEKITSSVDIPVIYKVGAEDKNILETCHSVRKAGASAVTLINRYVGFLVDIEKGEPHINTKAGVGGPWVLPLTLRWVSESYQNDPEFTICGSNGAYDWQDAVQFIMAGASVVQLCSVLILKGYKVITDIVDKLNEFMDKHNYENIHEMIGLATKRSKSYEDLYSLVTKASIDQEKCTKCKKCLRMCYYNGITAENDIVEITDNCRGCGLCEIACPSEAIKLITK